MVYEKFLLTVKEQLQLKLGDSYTLNLQKVQKNNDLTLDGLSILRIGENVAPTFYLNEAYEQYCHGTRLEKIVNDLYLSYQKSYPLTLNQNMLENFTNFSYTQNIIAFKLINTASNLELLKTIPHIPFLDLSIVFYMLINEHAQMTSLIRNDHLKLWNCTAQDLYEKALKNSQKQLPASLKPLKELMLELLPDPSMYDTFFPADVPDLEMYVLTNSYKYYGAACMLYPDIIKNFANTIGKDLLILPSSIHEVIMIPYETGIDIDHLSSIVNEANTKEVSPEEQLSNQVYHFSIQTNSITIISNSPDKVGDAKFHQNNFS